jgi:hypothetical protein
MLRPISACVIAIIAAVAGNLQNKRIRIVGHIPEGRVRLQAGPCVPGCGCCMCALVAVAGNLQNKGICIVGHIPKGKNLCIRVTAAQGTCNNVHQHCQANFKGGRIQMRGL